MDEETGRLLSIAGCKWIQMGVQSMDDDFKKDSLLRYESSADIERALKVMHKYNMKCKLDHMLGLPNEPISAQENAFNLYSDNHVNRIQTFWTCFLPGTKLMNEAIEDGRLTPKQIEDINEGRDFYFFRNTENIHDENLRKLYQSYEFIFRTIPAIPLKFRKKIKVESINRIPQKIKAVLTFLSDLIIGFSSLNPEFFAYLKHNLFHICRFMLKKVGFHHIKSTKPKNNLNITEYYMLEYERISKEKNTEDVNNLKDVS
jgi:radical SAM superfamily enzyme YgiQ (UPF0313 family)